MSRNLSKFEFEDYKLAIQSEIYDFLAKYKYANKYKYFSVKAEKIKHSSTMNVMDRIIIFYNGEPFCRFIIDSNSKITYDIKFVFSSPWLLRQLFKITCKLKRK